MSRDELFERIANGETMSDNQSLHSTVRSYMSQGGKARFEYKAAETIIATYRSPERLLTVISRILLN